MSRPNKRHARSSRQVRAGDRTRAGLPAAVRADSARRRGAAHRSSIAIRQVRERIERVAATDFTILIEGASGPQPHCGFIEVLCETAFGDSDREVERAGDR